MDAADILSMKQAQQIQSAVLHRGPPLSIERDRVPGLGSLKRSYKGCQVLFRKFGHSFQQ